MLPGRFHARLPRWIEAIGLGLTLAAGGCNDRDRLTFPTPQDPGPRTFIDQPSGDTTVPAGPGFLVTGFTLDADGVDTLYFETFGGGEQFPPTIGGEDSVRFVLPLTTAGQSGTLILVRVFATDRLRQRGDTATRLIIVQ